MVAFVRTNGKLTIKLCAFAVENDCCVRDRNGKPTARDEHGFGMDSA
jgi:hypothetical protein